MTQNNLGSALKTLGEREGGTARLEEAVAGYRAALEEQMRERVPLNWAMTHNNLGNALATLGEHESGTARLEEAVGAYRSALQEWTRERAPLDWATTQSNLGKALRILGERESGAARLLEAAEAWNACLEVTASAWPPDCIREIETSATSCWPRSRAGPQSRRTQKAAPQNPRGGLTDSRCAWPDGNHRRIRLIGITHFLFDKIRILCDKLNKGSSSLAAAWPSRAGRREARKEGLSEGARGEIGERKFLFQSIVTH